MTASAKEGFLGGLGSTSMLGLAVVVNALDPWRNHPLVSTFNYVRHIFVCFCVLKYENCEQKC